MSFKILAFMAFLVFSRFISPAWGDPVRPQPPTAEVMKVGGGDELNRTIHIGLIADMGSSVGKIALSCIRMGISDIYALNGHNGTRIELHTKDSRGDPLSVINAALDLLNNVKVQAIIVPELPIEASMVASLGDKAKIPVLSFTASPSATAPPYYLKIKEDETAQFDAIIALLEEFNWRNIVLLYEETDDGRNSLQHIVDKFQDKSLSVVYKSFVLQTVTDGDIIDELLKLKMMQTSVFIVHASPPLASKVIMNSKKIGMMSAGYAWVVTGMMMDFEDAINPLVIEAMQGALGLKTYIPASPKLQNFTLWWKRVLYAEPDLALSEFYIFGIRAYDTIWALTKADASLNTRLGTSIRGHDPQPNSADSRGPANGSEYLFELLNSKFRGLGGDYRFENGILVLEGYEVVNVVGNGGGIVGYWTSANGLSQEISSSVNGMDHSLTDHLKTIIWPGLSTNTPKNWLFHASGKRLQIAYPVKIGFTELFGMQEDKQKNVTTVTGFVPEVFKAAIESLGYDVPYDLVPYKHPTGRDQITYDEIVDSVYSKRYDAAIGDITITANRSLYVDFTIPYTELGLGTVAKLDRENRWFFLEPLDSNLWIVGACFFLSLGVVVWLIERPINEEFQGSVAQQIGTILWFSISTLVYAHREKLHSNLSKFVVGIWLFVVFILTSSYTAVLSSILTVQQIQSTRGDNIGYQYGSFVRGNVVNNFNFTVTDDRLTPFITAEQYADALSKGSNNGGVGAIIDELPYIKIFLAKYPSEYTLIETSYTTNGFGFFFQKGSPLVSELSRAIEHLRETGKLLELEEKWYNGGKRESPLQPQDNDQPKPKSLSLDNFLMLLFISGLSKIIVLAIILFFFLRKRVSLDNLPRLLAKAKLSSRVANATDLALPPGG